MHRSTLTTSTLGVLIVTLVVAGHSRSSARADNPTPAPAIIDAVVEYVLS
jgi:hypothetical protein